MMLYSVGLNEIHLTVPRELADVIAKSLCMTFEKSWQSGAGPGDWINRNIVSVF